MGCRSVDYFYRYSRPAGILYSTLLVDCAKHPCRYEISAPPVLGRSARASMLTFFWCRVVVSGMYVCMSTVTNEEVDVRPVEPVLARLLASLETLPRPVSPLCHEIPECDAGSRCAADQGDNVVSFIQHSRLASDRHREDIFSEEEYTFFSQVCQFLEFLAYIK